MDGLSLVPLLNGSAVTRDTVVGEYLAEGALAPLVMIKKGSLKFIASPGDPDQLYDLASDPNELRNLAASSQQAREVVAFRAELSSRWDLAALREKVVASQQRRRLIATALSVGAEPAWDYRTAEDSGERYVRGADFWAPFKRARQRLPADGPR